MVSVSPAAGPVIRYGVRQALIVGVSTLCAALILVPVVWMVSAGLRPIKEMLAYPPTLLPRTATKERGRPAPPRTVAKERGRP